MNTDEPRRDAAPSIGSDPLSLLCREMIVAFPGLPGTVTPCFIGGWTQGLRGDRGDRCDLRLDGEDDPNWRGDADAELHGLCG